MAKHDEKEILYHMEIISKWQPPSEAVDQAIERVRKTLTKAQTKQAVSDNKKWRTVKQIIKFAVAAVVIMAVIIGITQFGDTTAKASVCWAEVAQKLEQIEMFICRGQRGSAEAVKEGTAEIYWTEYYSSKHGIRWDKYHQEEKIANRYIIPAKNVSIYVDHLKKTYNRVIHSEEIIIKTLDYYDPKKVISKLLSSEYTQLPRKKINGVEVEGIEGVLEFEAQQFGQKDSVICFWVDVKTQLPVLLEWKRVIPDGTAVRTETVIDQFKWDVDLGPGIFEPNIPADYTSTK